MVFLHFCEIAIRILMMTLIIQVVCENKKRRDEFPGPGVFLQLLVNF